MEEGKGKILDAETRGRGERLGLGHGLVHRILTSHESRITSHGTSYTTASWRIRAPGQARFQHEGRRPRPHRDLRV